MKTMRYRIRVVAFILVCALFASILFILRTIWLPADDSDPNSSPFPPFSVSVPVKEPYTSATPSAEFSPAVLETPSAEPLFDVFGL